MVLSWCNLYTSLFLGIEADVLKAKKLHLIGFTHDQVVKHLLCNLIMCGPNFAVVSMLKTIGTQKLPLQMNI